MVKKKTILTMKKLISRFLKNLGYILGFRLARILGLLLFITLYANIEATLGQIPNPDTSQQVAIKLPPSSKLAHLRLQKKYQYGIEQQLNDTWSNRLLGILIKWLSGLFGQTKTGIALKIIAYIFVAAVIVFVVLKLIGIEFSGIFGRKINAIEIPYETQGENIHAINFEDSIQEALLGQNYRLAVRLHYLQTLKALANQQMIDWRINKTNRSYVYELNSPILQKEFEYITTQFEYAWYGDFSINQESFNELQKQFIHFNRSITRTENISQKS